MEKVNIVALVFGIIFCLLIGQNNAWGNLGNRSYSSWYETHFLIEKKGLCELIYFKPKHFGRYTLYEVVCFFVSFILPIVFAVLAILLYIKILSSFIFNVIINACVLLFFISGLIIVIINDVGSYKDNKKRFYLESGERENTGKIDNLDLQINHKNKKLINKVLLFGIQTRNNTYFTIYNLRDSYYQRMKRAGKDAREVEKVNKEYMEYFKDINGLIVIKENKDGTLVFKN